MPEHYTGLCADNASQHCVNRIGVRKTLSTYSVGIRDSWVINIMPGLHIYTTIGMLTHSTKGWGSQLVGGECANLFWELKIAGKIMLNAVQKKVYNSLGLTSSLVKHARRVLLLTSKAVCPTKS